MLASPSPPKQILGLCYVCIAVFILRSVVSFLIATQAIPNSAGYPLSKSDVAPIVNRFVYDTVRRRALHAYHLPLLFR